MPSRRKSRSSKRSTCAPSRTPGSKRPARSNEEPMNWKKVFAVVRREYIERVRSKAFWIGTLIFPGLFIGIIGFQIVLSHRAGGERHLAVVDTGANLYAPLKAELDDLEKERKEKDLKANRTND